MEEESFWWESVEEPSTVGKGNELVTSIRLSVSIPTMAPVAVVGKAEAQCLAILITTYSYMALAFVCQGARTPWSWLEVRAFEMILVVRGGWWGKFSIRLTRASTCTA